MKVLVATDGTAVAIDAAKVGLALLRDGAEILLVTVIQDYEDPMAMAGGFEGPLVTPKQAEADYERQLGEGACILDRTKAALGRDVDVRLVPTDDDPGHAIVAIANELQPDVIVMGSKEKGFFHRLVAGSVSDFVIRHAPCPVLVVPHGRGGGRSGL